MKCVCTHACAAISKTGCIILELSTLVLAVNGDGLTLNNNK